MMKLKIFGALFDSRRSAEMIARENNAQLTALAVDIEREVVARTPINTGTLRDSVYAEVRGASEIQTGKIVAGIGASYASYAELGTRPHWPHLPSLMLWVRRKLGIHSESELRSVTFLIARKIAQRGTKGKRMFEQGLSAVDKTLGHRVRRWEQDIIRRMKENTRGT